MYRRLLVSHMMLALLVLLVLEIPLGLAFANSQRADAIATARDEASSVAALAEAQLERGVDVDLPEAVRQIAGGTGTRVLVVNRHGEVIASSHHASTAGLNFADRPEIAEALNGEESAGSRYAQTFGAEILYLAVPVGDANTVYGAVRVARPTAALQSSVRSIWVALGLFGLGVLASCAVLGAVISRWVVRPVRQLERAATELAGGRHQARAREHEGPAEVRRLARAFNDMAAQLQSLLEAQQAFVADASHQLRSPLAALSLRVENLEPHLDASARPGLDAVLSEVQRLRRLTDDMLTLAKAETAPASTVIDVSAVVRAHHARWAPLAGAQDVALQVQFPDRVLAFAVPDGLEQILDNLTSNALEALTRGEGQTIGLGVNLAGKHVEVHVVDDGPGLTEEQRRRAFDRFWRQGSGHGAGLGLAIVARIAAASGGHVELRHGPGGRGLDAVVALRQAPPEKVSSSRPRPEGL